MRKKFCELIFVSRLALVLPFIATASPPTIDYQPQSQKVILYQQAAFGVIARSDVPKISYQWLKNGAAIPNATNDQIVIPQSQFSDEGFYSVIVSNSESSVTSEEAELRVNLPKAGDVDGSFVLGSSIDQAVRSIAVEPDGKVLIAGDFSMVHGMARGGIARLNADGTTDHTFMNGLSGVRSSHFDGSVYSVIIQSDSKIVIGGSFSGVHGELRSNIARLNVDGSLDHEFRASVSGPVYTIKIQADGKLLLGGQFTQVNGIGRTNIARLNRDGSLDQTFETQMDSYGYIQCLQLQSDGKVLIGGWNFMVEGGPRSSLTRLNPNGTHDPDFPDVLILKTNSYPTISSLMLQGDGKILIAGGFDNVNGANHLGIARLNSDGTLDSSFNPKLPIVGNADSVEVKSFTLQNDGKILVAGGSSRTPTVGPAVQNRFLTRFIATGSLDSSFSASIDDSIETLVLQDDEKILIGGNFSLVNNQDRRHLARLGSSGQLDASFNNGTSGANSWVNSVVVQSDEKILVAGNFEQVDGQTHSCLARLNPNGSSDGFGKLWGDKLRVWAVAVQTDGKILVGGERIRLYSDRFERYYPERPIERLYPDGRDDLAFRTNALGYVNPIYSGSVSAIAVQSDGKILIGGKFYIYSSPVPLARLNSDGTLDTSFQISVLGTNESVSSIVLQSDGKVLICGYFNQSVGSSIARLNSDGTLDETFRSVVSPGGIASMRLQSDQKVIIGGQFSTVNGSNRQGIARLNSDGTLDTIFQPRIPGTVQAVYSIAIQSDGKFVIAGGFRFDETIQHTILRLNRDGNLDESFESPLSKVYPEDAGLAVALQNDGKIVLGGYFTQVKNVPAAFLVRLLGEDSQPVLKNLTRNQEDVNLSWRAISNRTYRVQFSDDLSKGSWINLLGDISATGGTASKTDTSSSSAEQRFYRVLQIP